MARGWESKSVEAQIDEAGYRRSAVLEKTTPPEKLELIRKRETIALSRTRVIRELQTAQNPRYKAVLSKALADLEAQLSTFAAG
ncbi:MAG: hypothetical protein LAQ69_46500 [Acidobacteriia bacterium]|nr:hypothetical protein [Terriglobia bacterium]